MKISDIKCDNVKKELTFTVTMTNKELESIDGHNHDMFSLTAIDQLFQAKDYVDGVVDVGDATAPKKRGRPKGSKNRRKPKPTVTLYDELFK